MRRAVVESSHFRVSAGCTTVTRGPRDRPNEFFATTGVQVFGIIGLILGPVIVTLSLAILRTYESEVAPRADG
jgi:hypothetical protein